MRELTALLATGLGAGFVVAVVFALFMLFIGWPLLAWSALKQIKHIRLQLERLNDTLESTRATSNTSPLGRL